MLGTLPLHAGAEAPGRVTRVRGRFRSQSEAEARALPLRRASPADRAVSGPAARHVKVGGGGWRRAAPPSRSAQDELDAHLRRAGVLADHLPAGLAVAPRTSGDREPEGLARHARTWIELYARPVELAPPLFYAGGRWRVAELGLQWPLAPYRGG